MPTRAEKKKSKSVGISEPDNRRLYEFLKKVIQLPVDGKVSVALAAGLISHIFSVAIEGRPEFHDWLSRDAILKSWIDGVSGKDI